MITSTPPLLDRLFRLSERGSTVRTELLAGLTTFLTMSYIIVVNPAILADAGIPKQAALAATILASVVCTVLMGLWANFPVAVAPGMGLNAFFTYSVVLGHGLSWRAALGAVFISGLIFMILSVTGIRRRLVDGVPETLRAGIGVGIGLFIAFIGLKNAGVIVPSQATFVTLGHLAAPGPLLALSGLLVAAALTVKRVPGALMLSILGVTAVAMAIGATPRPTSFGDVVATQWPSLAPTFMQMDLQGAIGYGLVSIVFSFTVVELFDNLATLIGLTRKAGLTDAEGRVPDLDKALVADAAGTMASAALGSTAMNAYVENATGIAEGGRTGLMALTVAGLFALALVFTPLVGFVPGFATAPALVLVGAFMLGEIRHVPFDDLTEALPAFLTIALMPLTFSIAEGLAFGFLSYVVLKVLTGRWRDVHPLTAVIAAAFAVNFAFHG